VKQELDKANTVIDVQRKVAALFGETMPEPTEEVYAKLLEDGEYLCSERTMYRVFAEHDQVRERRAQRRRPEYVKPQLVATAPNQV
jgi:hypothetical protein